MYTFSELEKDEKTFEYLKEYVKLWRSNSKSSFASLDMALQKREIITHLYLNGMQTQDQMAILGWIAKYGPSFRAYLNSIKLVFLTWHCMGRDWDDIRWGDYCTLRDRMLEVKDVCIDSIVVERETHSFGVVSAEA